MDTKAIEEYLSSVFNKTVIDHAVRPRNMMVPTPPYLHDFHQTANNERIDFYIKLDGDKIIECTFTAEGRTSAFASASVVTEMVKGMKVSHALSFITAESIAEELGGLPEEEAFGAALAEEALKKVLIKSFDVVKHPWKALYSKG